MAWKCDFDKARNVTAMFYPEECGKTYGELLEFLDGLTMPCACSPLHDSDVYTAGDVQKWIKRNVSEDGTIPEEVLKKGIPEVGQAKKVHVHLLLCAPGPWPAEKFKELFSDFCEIGYFQKVNSVSSLLRYFAHLDSPQKHQYNALDVHGFGGLDLSPLLKIDKVSSIETLLDVMDHIETRKVQYYHSLVGWAISTADIDTICCVTGRASFFANYFKSKTEEKIDKAKKKKAEEERAALENGCSSYYDGL